MARGNRSRDSTRCATAMASATGSSSLARVWIRSWCSHPARGLPVPARDPWNRRRSPISIATTAFSSSTPGPTKRSPSMRRPSEACAQIFGQKDQTLAPRKGSTTRLFVARAKDLLLFGLQSDHSVDLIQIRNAGGRGTAACVGLLLYSDDVVAFRAARDGHTLLAGGRNLGLSWSVAEKVSSKAVALAKEGGLLEAACEEGLRGHESPTDDWATTTYLGVQPVTLCDGTPARSAVKQRGSSVLPGVDVDLDRKNLPSAFTKEGSVQKKSQ
jgi:hypothetical protein